MKHMILLPAMLTAAFALAQQAHHITLEKDVFHPEFLVVEAGDPISVSIHGAHTLTEVSATTFRAGGITPNGGIHIGAGTALDHDSATFSLNETGEYYFISEGHNAPQAKLHIVVISATNTGITANVDATMPAMFPNPADDHVRFPAHEHLDMMSVEAFDQSGRLVLQAVVRGNEPLNLMSLPSGHYTLRLTDGMSTVFSTERLIINRKGLGS